MQFASQPSGSDSRSTAIINVRSRNRIGPESHRKRESHNPVSPDTNLHCCGEPFCDRSPAGVRRHLRTRARSRGKTFDSCGLTRANFNRVRPATQHRPRRASAGLGATRFGIPSTTETSHHGPSPTVIGSNPTSVNPPAMQRAEARIQPMNRRVKVAPVTPRACQIASMKQLTEPNPSTMKKSGTAPQSCSESRSA